MHLTVFEFQFRSDSWNTSGNNETQKWSWDLSSYWRSRWKETKASFAASTGHSDAFWQITYLGRYLVQDCKYVMLLFKVCKTIMYLVFTHDTVLLNVDTMYKSMCGLDAMKCRGKQHILQKDVYICKQILRWFLPNLSCYLVKTQHSLGEGTILVFWFEPFAEDVTICYSFNGCLCILFGT